MTIFDEATAVRRISDGVYEARPDQRFALVAPGGKTPPAVNGGVLIATVLRAVLDCSPLPHPVATSAHFLRMAKLAPAQIHVTWLRTGRTAATARATLTQDGEAVLETTMTMGTVPAACRRGRRRGTGQAELDRRGTRTCPARRVRRARAVAGDHRAGRPAGYAAQIRMLLDPP